MNPNDLKATLQSTFALVVYAAGICVFIATIGKATGLMSVRLGFTELGVLALATIAAK